ncbi:MAG: ATP-dependent 6-phosphofructokinase [Myxococcales bacterium]|nr:ATP-dependent 6-phosphofructokinase [Myxococcales bacterium]
MRIGVTTGGGDCAGLNAVIRAVVKSAILEHRDEVIGIEDGFDQFIRRQAPSELTLHSVRGILARGGTILGTTNRGNPFHYVLPGMTKPTDCSDLVVRQVQQLGLDALIVIGGDGTMSIAYDLFRKGLPLVGVPKTIDNDLGATDYTFGFDTAVNFAMDALDRLRTTAESHERVMILEVMGRYAGWIALHTALAGGAHACLIPEIEYDPQLVVDRIRRSFAKEGNFYLIVVAEGAKPAGGVHSVVEHGTATRAERLGGAGEQLASAIQKHIDQDIRVTVLGHLQRGGSPTSFDRILATRFGYEAVRAVHASKFGQMVALKGQDIITVPMESAIAKLRLVDPKSPVVLAARSIGICFGDDE